MAASPGGIEVNRISVKAVPDTSDIYPQLKRDLEEIERRVMLDVKASVNTEELTASAREAVAQAQAAAGDIDVKMRVDKSQLSEATSAFSGLASSISGAGIAAAGLGPALIPIGAVLGAIAAALAAPIAVAAGGVTLWAFLTGAAIKKTEDQKKQIDQLKKSVDSAKQSLDNTTASAATSAKNSLSAAQDSARRSIKSAQQSASAATTAAGQVAAANRIEAAHAALASRRHAIEASQSASVASAQRKYNDALLKYHAALNGLTPAQEKFLEAQKGLSDAFHDLIVKVGPALLGPVTQVLNLLATSLPSLTPIIRTVSDVMSGLVKQVADAAKSPGFKRFIDSFAHELGPDLRSFAKIAENIFTGLFGLFGAFNDQLSGSVLKGLENITGKFADFGKQAGENKGLRSFIDYAKKNMPAVGRVIGGTFEALAKALGALAPAGSAVLGFLDDLLSSLDQLNGAAGPLAAVLGGLAIGSFFGPEVGLTVAAVVALATGFQQLYQHSKPLRQIIHDIGDYFSRVWVPRIKDAANDVMPALQSAIKDVSDTIRDNKGLFEVLGKALAALVGAGVIASIEQVAVAIRLIGKAFKYGTEAVKIWANVTLTIFRVVLVAIGAVVSTILNQFGNIVDAAAAAFGWMPGIGGKVKAAKAAFDDFTSHVTGTIDDAGATLKHLQDEINEVGRSHPSFRIDSNTLAVIAQMHELDALRFKDKNLKIGVHIEEQIDRVRGPGGGMGRPGDLAPRTSSDRSGSSGAGINIQNATFTDARDLSRQAAKWRRGRAGGGVSLRVSPAVG